MRDLVLSKNHEHGTLQGIAAALPFIFIKREPAFYFRDTERPDTKARNSHLNVVHIEPQTFGGFRNVGASFLGINLPRMHLAASRGSGALGIYRNYKGPH